MKINIKIPDIELEFPDLTIDKLNLSGTKIDLSVGSIIGIKNGPVGEIVNVTLDIRTEEIEVIVKHNSSKISR